MNAISPAPGLQKQPVRSETLCRRGDAVDVALIDDAAVGMQEVERDRGASLLPGPRPVDGRRRRAVGVPQGAEGVEQPGTERGDARVDRLEADAVEQVEADLDGGQVQVVDRAVLEVRGAGCGLVVLALDERGDDRAAGEPWALELGERVAAGEQTADAGRPAEHLVERERHEVRDASD